jgi:hypothetical protein
MVRLLRWTGEELREKAEGGLQSSEQERLRLSCMLDWLAVDDWVVVLLIGNMSERCCTVLQKMPMMRRGRNEMDVL